MEKVQIDLLIEAGESAKTLGQVKQSIKDVTKAINEVQFGSEEFRKLDKVLKDNRETVRNLKKDFDTFQNVSIFAKNVSSSFGIATSAMGLFGSQSEAVEKTLLKVTSAFALVQSIQEFADSLKLAESANKALNASLLTNPYVLVAAGIAAVVAALYLFSQKAKEAEEAQARLNSEHNIAVASMAELAVEYQNITGKINDRTAALAKSMLQEEQAIEQLKQKKKDLIADDKFTEEEKKRFEQQLTGIQTKGILERKVINAKFNKDEKKEREDKAKEAIAEGDKKTLERNAQLEKENAEKERLRLVVINETKKGLDKELALYDENSTKRIADLKAGGVTVIEITRIIAEGRQKIIDEFAKKESDAIEAKEVKNIELLEAGIAKQIAAQKRELDIKKAKIDVIQDEKVKEQELGQLKQEQILYVNQNIQAYKNEIASIEASNIASDKKIEKIDAIKEKIKDLEAELEKLGISYQKADSKGFSETTKKQIAEAQGYMQQISSVYTELSNIISQAVQQQVDTNIAEFQRENDAYTEGLNERLKNGEITQAEYDNKKAEADKQLKAQEKKEKHKAFVANKTMAIIGATINTALAVTSALTQAPPASYIMAALSAGLGIAQIAVIASQKEPAFARGGVFAGGGMVTGAGSGVSDGVNARLSAGESIINANSTSAFRPILSAINQAGGGVAFKGEKSIVNNPSGIESNNQTVQSSQPMLVNVSISEAEISKVQDRVQRINVRSTF